MDLKQIRYFVHVARLRSFSKAARALDVAQPALSRHIQSLEADLKTQLLFRTTRGVVPTDAGLTLMRMGEALLNYVDRMRDEVSRMAKSLSGNVIVGMPQSIAPTLAPLVIEECQRRFPNVALRVTEGLSVFLEEWLNLGKIDLAVMTNLGDVPTLRTTRLAREHMVFIGGIDKMPVGRKDVALAELVDYPMVVAHGFRRIVDRWTAPLGVSLNYTSELDSIAIIKEMVMHGFCYSIIPYATVHREALNGDIGVLPIVDPMVTRELVLAVNAHRPMSAAGKAVQQVVMDTVKQIELRPPQLRAHAARRVADPIK